MVGALPSVMVSDPPVGACCSIRNLIDWAGTTRQALHRQRQTGRILVVRWEGSWVYPETQVDDRRTPDPHKGSPARPAHTVDPSGRGSSLVALSTAELSVAPDRPTEGSGRCGAPKPNPAFEPDGRGPRI